MALTGSHRPVPTPDLRQLPQCVSAIGGSLQPSSGCGEAMKQDSHDLIPMLTGSRLRSIRAWRNVPSRAQTTLAATCDGSTPPSNACGFHTGQIPRDLLQQAVDILPV